MEEWFEEYMVTDTNGVKQRLALRSLLFNKTRTFEVVGISYAGNERLCYTLKEQLPGGEVKERVLPVKDVEQFFEEGRFVW